MVHPSVPCMVVTPICPHSLSFRSIVVPSGVEITVSTGHLLCSVYDLVVVHVTIKLFQMETKHCMADFKAIF